MLFDKQVKLGRKAQVPVSIAVNTFGFHLISLDTNVSSSTRYDIYRKILRRKMLKHLNIKTFTLPPPLQSLITSLSYGSVDWDASDEKHCILLSRSDKTLHIEIRTRMVREKPVLHVILKV